MGASLLALAKSIYYTLEIIMKRHSDRLLPSSKNPHFQSRPSAQPCINEFYIYLHENKK